MPEQDGQPPVVEYFRPRARRSWFGLITGWDWTLLVTVAATVFLRMHPAVLIIGRHGPGTGVVHLMFLLIGVRVGWAVLRRDRSFWWIPYLLLVFALPVIADAVTRFAWSPLGEQISTDLYHFWRDLF